MINLRLASVPVLKSNSLAVLRGLTLAWPSSIAIPRARTADRSVAWTWSDLGRVAIMTGLIVAGGAFTLVLLGLGLSLGFTLAEAFGVIPLGTFDRITSFCTPYSAAGAYLDWRDHCSMGRLPFQSPSTRWSATAFRGAPWDLFGYPGLSWAASRRVSFQIP